MFSIPLGKHPKNLKAAVIPASNSIARPPAVLAATSDGRYAFVLETFGLLPNGPAEQHMLKDLQPGAAIRVFEIADPAKPRELQTLIIPQRPDSLSVNATGTQLAVTFHPEGAGTGTPLALIPFENGRLGKPVTPEVPGWIRGNRMIVAEWHPSLPVLAVADGMAERILFYDVSGTGLTQRDNGVGTEKETYILRFSSDGRHLIANALYWGPDVEGAWNEAPRGSVYVVRFDAGKNSDGTLRHALVSRAMTGVSPEGLAISPDGKWVVTTNLERSYLPWDDTRLTPYSSLSLFRFDAETGQLTPSGAFAFDGILPEAAAFDASSSALAVVTYDHFAEARKGGSVDFWQLTSDPLNPGNTILVKTNHSVPITRGRILWCLLSRE